MSKEKQMYVTAEEVAEIVGVSKGHAYKLIKRMNEELEEKGFIVIAGKVPRRYFEERCYGTERGIGMNGS